MTIILPDLDLDLSTLEQYEFEIPCDYGDGERLTPGAGIHDDKAEWVLYFRDHGCDRPDTSSLACDRCKTFRLESTWGLIHCIHCGIYLPASEFYLKAERLTRE